MASGASCAETAQTWLPTETHEDLSRCAAVTAQNSEDACESILKASTGDNVAAKACTYKEVGDYSSKWDVTVTIVVVAEASMLDASLTTLSLGAGQSAPVAGVDARREPHHAIAWRRPVGAGGTVGLRCWHRLP